MNEFTKWIALISLICTAISAVLGIFTYRRQQNINRIQNLVAVFQRFSNNDDFLSIFSTCDAGYVRLKPPYSEQDLSTYLDKLKSISAEKKFKYLAILEEIAILARISAVIQNDAIHLFKFHFYYLYGNHKISSAFWDNIGSGPNEKNKEGWSYQSDFAKICETNFNR